MTTINERFEKNSDGNEEDAFNQGPYSPTVLKNYLCFLLQDLQFEPYGLANQKLCYIQMLLNVEKSRQQN